MDTNGHLTLLFPHPRWPRTKIKSGSWSSDDATSSTQTNHLWSLFVKTGLNFHVLHIVPSRQKVSTSGVEVDE